MDLAIINHRLAKRITERAMNYGTNTAEKAPVHDFSSNQIRGKDKDKVFVQEKLSLSLGEKRALRVSCETCEIFSKFLGITSG